MFAVLRVRFDTNHDPASVWSDQLFHNWWDPAIPNSVAHYWHEASRGTFDTRHVLYPPYVMADPRPYAPAGTDPRGTLVSGAITKAHELVGFNADGFSHVMIWFAQGTDMFGGWPVAVPFAAGGSVVLPAMVCDIHSNFDMVCHELGHAYGLGHPWGTLPGTEYADPYDIMGFNGSAATFLRAPTGQLPDGIRAPNDTWPYPGTPPGQLVGPLLSGAQLFKIEVFKTPQHTIMIDPTFPNGRTKLRIHALDSQHNPFLAAIPVGGRHYTIELRRDRGYDQGIGDVDGPASGLVVHCCDHGRVDYEGMVPIPSDGDLDWHSGYGHFSVQLADAADDLEWADFYVGGESFWRRHGVSIDEPVRSERAVSRTDEQYVINTPCVAGTYVFHRIRRRVTSTQLATSTGFETPLYRWWINGVELAAGSEQSVRVAADVRTPPSGPGIPETVSKQHVMILYSLAGPVLKLDSGLRSSGNFHCTVDVEASEGNPGVLRSVIPKVTASRIVTFRCIDAGWDANYHAAFERCFGGVRNRFAQNVPPKVHIDPGDPVPYFVDPADLHELLGYEATLVALEKTRPDLAEELASYVRGRFQITAADLHARVMSFSGEPPEITILT